MNKIWKNTGSRIWLIVSAIVVVLALVVNILASTLLYNLVNTILGGERIKLLEEGKEAYVLDEGITDKATAKANGDQVTLNTTREGFTLLKNNNNALPVSESETKVSIFGKNSVNMAIGGSGSGGSVGAESKSIFDSLTASGFTYNQTLVDFYNDPSKSGEGRDANPTDLDSGKPVELSEGETPISSYTQDIWDSCANYNDVALVVITRIGGEGFDMPRYEDGTHFLQLSQNEKDLINKVTSLNFGKVVVVLNVAATMELKDVHNNDGVDAILWIGYAGGNGMMAFGEILKGQTVDGEPLSPSGKTVDTYAATFANNPTWNNFGAALGALSGIPGDAFYSQAGRGNTSSQTYFVDYEENIYVGYRYYETAAAEGYIDYEEEVVYPFGYGLTYSEDFTWELENANEIATTLEKDTAMTFKVKVTNNGDFPAKDVVQLYVTPHYNEGGIEKSHKVLVGFAKTETLSKGQSEVVEITVDSPYEYASYDYSDANSNGFKGYEVEAGNYLFTISTDSHNAKNMDNAVVTAQVASDIRYENDSKTGTAVKNLYTDNEDDWYNSNAQLGVTLSRSDMQATWPQVRANEEKKVGEAVTQEYIDKLKSTTPNPNRPVLNDTMPTMGKVYEQEVTQADGSVTTEELVYTLSDMKGLDYNDELWNKFMDQLTASEMLSLVNNGGFHTEAVQRLGVPRTTSADGPVGWCNFMGDPTVYDTCVYCCEVVLSSTWNIDRLEDMGRAVGNEALIGNAKGDGTPYTGWYAPGLNIHRTPFGGRNFEYYSEDPFLSGQMTAAVVKGAAEKGVYVNMKHFALNDQETHRSVNLTTWATEQSMREIYLKAFEVAIKTAKYEYNVKALGVMSSFNKIGSVFAGGDYRLLTTILRGEWGFEGLVICDFNTCSHMIEKDMIYAGGDLNLQVAGTKVWNPDESNASDMTVLRQGAKNILYTIANSNAVRGEFEMIMPIWQMVMFIVDGALAVVLGAWGFFAIKKALKEE